MWLGTRSRHFGHKVVFITQRPQGVDRMVRDQCEELSCFMLSKYDTEQLAREYPQMGLERVHLYPKGYYREGTKFGSGRTINVFTGEEVPEPELKENDLAVEEVSDNIEDEPEPKVNVEKENEDEHKELFDERTGSTGSTGSTQEIRNEVSSIDDAPDDDITLMFYQPEDDE
jgi:hypothetical protein